MTRCSSRACQACVRTHRARLRALTPLSRRCPAPAGGNGIAAALSAFQELAAAGTNTQGMPALLVWTTRHGHEMAFAGPRVMAAAKALGLQLTCHFYVTGERPGAVW